MVLELWRIGSMIIVNIYKLDILMEGGNEYD